MSVVFGMLKQIWHGFSRSDSYGPGSEDKCDRERPVNSLITWCLPCLIKHIIDHRKNNDSSPVTHESIGFGITTTWPQCGFAVLDFRVRVYLLFTTVSLPAVGLWALPIRKKKDGSRKMQLLEDYHTASVWLFSLNSWIYMNPLYVSIWKTSHLCLAAGILLVSLKSPTEM